MTVAGIALDTSNHSPIVLLRDPSGCRQVPIWIDHEQAHSIVAGLKQAKENKPLSHDLMISLLKAGNLNLKSVIIHEVEDNNCDMVFTSFFGITYGDTNSIEISIELYLLGCCSFKTKLCNDFAEDKFGLRIFIFLCPRTR